ncbi:MAG: hypothetical protein Q9202_007310 [Teloschistes flavicans]
MPLVLSEQIHDTDFEHLFAIQYNAFWKDPVIRAFYPGGLSDSARWDNVEIFIRTLGWRAHNVATAKVVDVQTGEICAFATMRMFDENPFTFAQPPHFEFPHIDEALRPAVEWVLNSKDTRRRTFEALHAPGSYCCLGTDPAHQRRGAATLLVEWAIKTSEHRGSTIMVEASRDAVDYGLYTKRGFQTIDTHHYFDPAVCPAGFDGMHVTTLLRKPGGK